MNPLGYETSSEESWLLMIKKEMLENQKSKESFYNFDFNQEKSRPGKIIWEKIQDPYRDLAVNP
jgi:hypothetical protein